MQSDSKHKICIKFNLIDKPPINLNTQIGKLMTREIHFIKICLSRAIFFIRHKVKALVE